MLSLYAFEKTTNRTGSPASFAHGLFHPPFKRRARAPKRQQRAFALMSPPPSALQTSDIPKAQADRDLGIQAEPLPPKTRGEDVVPTAREALDNPSREKRRVRRRPLRPPSQPRPWALQGRS